MNVSCCTCEHSRWENDSKMCETCDRYNNWARRVYHAKEESGRNAVCKSDQGD